MSTLRIKSGVLKGSIVLPSSKSQTMRAIIFGSLGQGKSEIYNYLKSPDVLAMVEAMRSLGVAIHMGEHKLEIEGVNGNLQPCDKVIDCGNSGQVLRFVGSLAALLPTYTVLTGDTSICYQRPVQPLLSALNQLQAFAVSTRLNDCAPIIVKGCMQPGRATLSGQDSQPVSGLLIATSFLKGTTHLVVTDPGEKPWIDLTLSWLHRLGAHVSHHQYTDYKIVGPLRYQGFTMHVPGDFSSAAFPLVAAFVTRSSLRLENVEMNEVQGDKKIIDLLRQMGARIQEDRQNLALNIEGDSSLQGRQVDVNDLIDAIPILAVLGCFAQCPLHLTNAAIARKKESDRLHVITTELSKMGAKIEEEEAGLKIYPASLVGARVHSHHDHRIAMALAVAALGAKGETHIEDIRCIAKSYPTFVRDFQHLGAQIEELL
ncbi:MAG: 3-phosphoshikimate 1-carboxyvinyltransferase [Verrucomicrobia bacterium]|nr:3-phosphoshikimate 1-carboxyvinyltransferase [Verrucomicrobiota bacterium]MBS0646921.1 3-phosphoshikimate 1-carboxyvinyltransferase [Verrucomicrobiota bacterium]